MGSGVGRLVGACSERDLAPLIALAFLALAAVARFHMARANGGSRRDCQPDIPERQSRPRSASRHELEYDPASRPFTHVDTRISQMTTIAGLGFRHRRPTIVDELTAVCETCWPGSRELRAYTSSAPKPGD